MTFALLHNIGHKVSLLAQPFHYLKGFKRSKMSKITFMTRLYGRV